MSVKVAMEAEETSGRIEAIPHVCSGEEVSYYSNDFSWEDHAVAMRSQVSKIPELEDGAKDAYVEGCQQNQWENFYSKHQTGSFFKPRNYLMLEFPELLTKERTRLFELGCGHGCSLIPILRSNPDIEVFACDFSEKAIEIFKNHEDCQRNAPRCHTFVLDPLTDPFPDSLSSEVDIVLMVFFLSAILPEGHHKLMRKIFNISGPGTVVCFRDYGLYDLTMVRSTKRIGEQLFARADGTLAFFFTPKYLLELFSEAGFRVLENQYCTVSLKNRKQGTEMRRVFCHVKAKRET